ATIATSTSTGTIFERGCITSPSCRCCRAKRYGRSQPSIRGAAELVPAAANQNAGCECKSEPGSRARPDQRGGPVEAGARLSDNDDRGTRRLVGGRLGRRRSAGNQHSGESQARKQRLHRRPLSAPTAKRGLPPAKDRQSAASEPLVSGPSTC